MYHKEVYYKCVIFFRRLFVCARRDRKWCVHGSYLDGGYLFLIPAVQPMSGCRGHTNRKNIHGTGWNKGRQPLVSRQTSFHFSLLQLGQILWFSTLFVNPLRSTECLFTCEIRAVCFSQKAEQTCVILRRESLLLSHFFLFFFSRETLSFPGCARWTSVW